MSKRWSKEEIEFLKDKMKTESFHFIAEKLGRTWHAVRTKVGKLGFRPILARMKADHLEEIRRLHAQGMCDPDIASHLGFDRSTIGYRRRSLGLKSNSSSDHQREKLRHGVRKQCERLGISSPGELRVVAWKKRARAHGWPTEINGRCITRRQIEILDALYVYGPHTRRQLAKRLGMKTYENSCKALSSRGGGRSYMRELVESGMVINLGRVVHSNRSGSGRNICLYALSLTVERNFDV